MLTVPHEDLSKGVVARLPLSEPLAQEFIDYLFKTKRWQVDNDQLLRKFRKFKQAALAEGKRLAAADALSEAITAPEDWPQRVRTEHRRKPSYWTVGRLAHLVSRTREEVEAALKGP